MRDDVSFTWTEISEADYSTRIADWLEVSLISRCFIWSPNATDVTFGLVLKLKQALVGWEDVTEWVTPAPMHTPAGNREAELQEAMAEWLSGIEPFEIPDEDIMRCLALTFAMPVEDLHPPIETSAREVNTGRSKITGY